MELCHHISHRHQNTSICSLEDINQTNNACLNTPREENEMDCPRLLGSWDVCLPLFKISIQQPVWKTFTAYPDPFQDTITVQLL